MSGVRAVLFDVFGTLVDWRGSLIADFTTFGEKTGRAGDWAGLVDAWRGAYQPSMQRVRSGAEPFANLDTLQRASLDDLLEKFAIEGVSAAERDWMVSRWHHLRPWPDSAAGLAALRAKKITGTLSNGHVALLISLAKTGDMGFDVIFGADIFRHYKPDRETYLGACALLDLPPGAVMLAAAHNSDLAAARACGLKTGFIPRPSEYGPSQQRDLRAEADWDVIAESVGALADKIG
jgi:2-haloacid dehalogenase